MRSSHWLLLLGLAACGSDPPLDDGANPDPRCNPLSPASAPAGTSCFLPFPSDDYLAKDTTSPTGRRVTIPVGVLPKNQIARDYDVARLNVYDGWSPSSPLVADVGAHVDPKSLPGSKLDFGPSILASSNVQLIAMDTGERVPLFAEVDVNVLDEAPQVVLIHPAMRLRSATRYVVALVNLIDINGKPVVIVPFQSLVSGKVGARLSPVLPRYQELFAFLEKAGVPTASLTLAWDFTTASDAMAHGHLVAMRDAALARWKKDDLGARFDLVEPRPGDAHIATHLRGTFDVPSFLVDNTSSFAGLQLDAQNHPVDSGTSYPASLEIIVPNCAVSAKAPVPVLIYGHGLFGDASDVDATDQHIVADQLCMVEIATNWVGLASSDMDEVVAHVFSDFDTFSQPTDRLQQGVVNFLVMARLALQKFPGIKELQRADGTPLTDGKQVYYFGISQGGIMGHTVMALSSDMDHGALNVGAGEYSLILTRSEDFGPFKDILDVTYPSQEAQEILFAISQMYWDYADPISFAPHLLMDTLPDESGAPLSPRHIVLQESHNDDEVPNVAARVLARTVGYVELTPDVEDVWGMKQAPGPLDAAYSQWDVKPLSLPPDGNTPAMHASGAHNAIGRLPALITQVQMLLRPGGQVVSTCNGPCIFPGAR